MESLTRLKREAKEIPSVTNVSIERDEYGTYVKVETEENVLEELDEFCEDRDAVFKPDGELLGRYYYALR